MKTSIVSHRVRSGSLALTTNTRSGLDHGRKKLRSEHTVDLTPVADVVQVDASQRDVKFVQDTVIANSQPELRPAFQSTVRKIPQARTHVIHTAPNRIMPVWRQSIERSCESVRPDLECGRHSLSRLACRIVPCGNLAARLVESRFNFVGQLELVLQKVVNPSSQGLNFFPFQPGNRRFYLFNCAHIIRVSTTSSGCKIQDCPGHPCVPRVPPAFHEPCSCP